MKIDKIIQNEYKNRFQNNFGVELRKIWKIIRICRFIFFSVWEWHLIFEKSTICLRYIEKCMPYLIPLAFISDLYELNVQTDNRRK